MDEAQNVLSKCPPVSSMPTGQPQRKIITRRCIASRPQYDKETTVDGPEIVSCRDARNWLTEVHYILGSLAVRQWLNYSTKGGGSLFPGETPTCLCIRVY